MSLDAEGDPPMSDRQGILEKQVREDHVVDVLRSVNVPWSLGE